MSNLKRITILLFAVIMVLGQTNVAKASTNGITDIDNHWAREAIVKWRNCGIIHGTPEGKYEPDKNTTRAEVIALINRIAGLTAKTDQQFEDVDEESWYAEDMLIAKKAGYLNTFYNVVKPNDFVTRQEAVMLIDRAFNLEYANIEADSIEFSDKDLIGNYAIKAIQRLVKLGVIEGYPDGSFKPNDKLTKSQLITMFDRLVGTYINDPGTYTISKVNKGIVVINSKDVIIEDSNIDNHLLITERVGDGEVTIKNTTISGSTIVCGGGENSIKIINSKISHVIVNRKEKKVRIVASKGTNIDHVSVKSNAKLQTEKGEKNYFTDIDIDVEYDFKGFEIELEGNFNNILIDSDVDVKVIGDTSIKKICTSKKAQPNIDISDETEILSAQIDSPTKITGNGKIKNMVVSAENVEIEPKVKYITVSSSVKSKPIIDGKRYVERSTSDSGGSSSTSNYSSDSDNNDDENEDNNNNEDDDNTSVTEKYKVDENEYYKVYCGKPLENGKLKSDNNKFYIECKDGYALDIPYFDVHVIESKGSATNYLTVFSHKLENIQDKIKVCELDIYKRLLKCGHNCNVNVEYIYDLKNKKRVLINCSTNISIEEYVGDRKPILIDELKNRTVAIQNNGLYRTGILSNKYTDLDCYVYDPYGDSLNYLVSCSDTEIAEAVLENNKVSITPKKAGDVTITVMAVDSQNNKIQTSYEVEVIDNPILINYNLQEGYAQIDFINGYYIENHRLSGFAQIQRDDQNIEAEVELKNIVYAGKDNQLVKSFRMYPKDKFSANKRYITEVSMSALCDITGQSVKYIYPYIMYKECQKGEILYEQEDGYFTLYSSLPLVDGKLDINSQITINFGDDFTIKEKDMRKFLNKYPGDVWARKHPNTEYVRQIVFNLYGQMLESIKWKYNNEYSMSVDYSKLLKRDGTSLNLDGDENITFTTETYKGDNNILSRGDIKDVKVVAGYSDITFNLDKIFYTVDKSEIEYTNIQSSNTDVCKACISNNICRLKSGDIGESNISITMKDAKNKIHNVNFRFSVVEAPMQFQLKYDPDLDVSYIAISLDENLIDDVDQICNIVAESSIELITDNKSLSILKEKKKSTELAIYCIDNSNNRINVDQSQYKIKRFPLYPIHGKVYNDLFYSSYDTELEFEPIIKNSISSIALDIQTKTINLEDYFFIPGDGDTYEVEVDETDKTKIKCEIIDNTKLKLTKLEGITEETKVKVTVKAINGVGEVEQEFEVTLTVSADDTTIAPKTLSTDTDTISKTDTNVKEATDTETSTEPTSEVNKDTSTEANTDTNEVTETVTNTPSDNKTNEADTKSTPEVAPSKTDSDVTDKEDTQANQEDSQNPAESEQSSQNKEETPENNSSSDQN